MQARPCATVDLVADIICPWCTVGRRRLDAALAELADERRPFLLYPDAPPGGVDQGAHLVRRFGSAVAADRYHDGVAEAGRDVGFDFRYDRIAVTPNTTQAHRLLLLAAGTGQQPMLAEMLARAFFIDGLDIGDADILAGLAAASFMDADAVRAMLEGDQHRADVVASDAAAKQAGIRYVPTFCLHGRILNVPDIEDLAGVLRTAHRALASCSSPDMEKKNGCTAPQLTSAYPLPTTRP